MQRKIHNLGYNLDLVYEKFSKPNKGASCNMFTLRTRNTENNSNNRTIYLIFYVLTILLLSFK